jgi:dTDP-4-amino-4,6-dideoxygalactose transaminase
MKHREIVTTPDIVQAMEHEMMQGNYTSGKYPELLEQQMCRITEKEYAVATNSGTSALKVALMAMGVEPGDWVVVPDLTFIACAIAVREVGAIPIFVDVDRKKYTIDWDQVRQLPNQGKIRAIMAVMLGGRSVDVPGDIEIPILLDAAHHMGRVGRSACFSFYPTKIISRS